MAIDKLKTSTILLFIMCMFFFACTNTHLSAETKLSEPSPAETESSAIEAQEEEIHTDQSQFNWSIEVLHSQFADNLSTTQSVIQYGGGFEEIPYEEKPGDGNTFLLVQMVIEKQKAGEGAFEWNHLYVLDAQGNKFGRHSNDTFLENHNLRRIKSVDLTIGKSEGFVCFELTKESANNKLILIYDAEESENRIELQPKVSES